MLGEDNLLTLSRAEMRRVWEGASPWCTRIIAAVNPAIPVGEQIAEIAREHLNMNKRGQEKALEMLTKCACPIEAVQALCAPVERRDAAAGAYRHRPDHQSRAADHGRATTALDVTTEAVILDLIHELLSESNTAILYITHNLGVVARIATVSACYAGEMMEEGTIEQVFKKTAPTPAAC